MGVEATALPMKQATDYRGILLGGLIAGIMDITAAIINTAIRSGRGPLFVFQSVASGILGADSYKDGLPAALLGAAIHFFIAFTACTVFFIASRMLTFLLHHPVISGLVYGVVVFFFMYGLVLRLTFHRNFLTPLSPVLVAILIHMFCVGLPISIAVHRFSKPAQ